MIQDGINNQANNYVHHILKVHFLSIGLHLVQICTQRINFVCTQLSTLLTLPQDQFSMMPRVPPNKILCAQYVNQKNDVRNNG
jgi:hypothetical protein